MEWRPRRNHRCQILCQSVKGFLGGSAPKMVISYTFLNDPYNSAALPCRLWFTVLNKWCKVFMDGYPDKAPLKERHVENNATTQNAIVKNKLKTW